MGERGRKWLSIAVMAITVAATVYGTMFYRTELEEFGHGIGPEGHSPQIYLWATEIAVCLAVWVATYLICGLIQRSRNVWQGFNLLPVLLMAVILVNFGPALGRLAGFNWPDDTRWQSPRMVEADFTATVIANANACQGELDAMGFPKFMRPVSLGAPKGVVRAREKLKEAQAVEEACSRRDEVATAKFRAEIATLRTTPARKDAMLATLAAGADSAEGDRIRLRHIDADLITEYTHMLDDLSAAKSTWYAHGFDMAFYSSRDAERFRAHANVVSKLAKARETTKQKLWGRGPDAN